jgi:hypothetical protein
MQGLTCSNNEPSSISHCVNGVSDKVVQNLSDVTFITDDQASASMLQVQSDVGVGKSTAIQPKGRLQKFFGCDGSRFCGLSMKAKRLTDNVRDTSELLISRIKPPLNFAVVRTFVACTILA